MECPTPRKYRFTNQADARRNLEGNAWEVGTSPDHYYRCECGYWHVAGSNAMVRDTSRKRNHRTKGGAKRYRARRHRRGCL